LLTRLEQLLVGISIMQDLTPRARDSLVSFGERLSVRLFAAFLRGQGVPAEHHDAFDIGVVTSDNFTSAGVHRCLYICGHISAATVRLVLAAWSALAAGLHAGSLAAAHHPATG
jgi:hypothetical protein